MGLSKSAIYYRENPEARKKKNEANLIYQKRKSAVKKRVECNRFNRKNGNYGNGDNVDCSHQKDGSLKNENQKTNRRRGGAERK